MKWQPIETAPKDKPILLADDHNVGEGEWRKGQQPAYGARGGEGWHFIDDIDYSRPFYPTHWMPLPKPPKSQ